MSPSLSREDADAGARVIAASEDWLVEWRETDFSWNGLARADWCSQTGEGHEAMRWRAPIDFPGDRRLVGRGAGAYLCASLQDYWRWSSGLALEASQGLAGGPAPLLLDSDLLELGLLVEYGGRLWHILHRPETQLSSALSRNSSGVANLVSILRNRVEAGRPFTDGPDHRLQLVGARAQGLDLILRDHASADLEPGENRVHVRAELSDLVSWNVASVSFGEGCVFRRNRFSGDCDLHGAQFADGNSFEQSVFETGCDFFSASFGRSVSFGQVIFGGPARFRAAAFGPGAAFRHSRFAQTTDFGSAVFGGGADFRGCHFGPETMFTSADLGPEARFLRTRFGEDVSFAFAKLPEATIEEAVFGARASFKSADLRGAHLRALDLMRTDICWSGAILMDTEFSNVTYERNRLRGNCEGLKGGASIWGDALLRRDLQDQDYIDTLNSRMLERKPAWQPAPKTGEGPLRFMGRFARNVFRMVDPGATPRSWAVMIVSALMAGLLAAALLDTSLFAGLPGAGKGAGPVSAIAGGAANIVLAVTGALAITLVIASWYGRRGVFKLWALLGYGRDWDRVAVFALVLIALFGGIYALVEGTHIAITVNEGVGDSAGSGDWFLPWFVAIMGFATLGIADVAEPMSGLGQILMIANVLAGFTIFGLLLAVLGNRFARRS